MRVELVGSVGVLVRALRIGNVVYLAAGLLVLAASVIFAVPIEAHLARKYAGGTDAATVLNFVRCIGVLALVAVWPIERLFRALARILGSVAAGDPFAGANAARLRTIGWALLALQLLDLGMGAAVWWAKAHAIEAVDWVPSLTGWLGVLVAFVLARVFAEGTALRDDLEGTI